MPTNRRCSRWQFRGASPLLSLSTVLRRPRIIRSVIEGTQVSIGDWIEVRAPKIESIYGPPPELIRCTQKELIWTFPDDAERLRELKPERDVFNRFLNLYDASPEQIARFAQRNGTLGLCHHGLPLCHSPNKTGAPLLAPPPYCASFDPNRRRRRPLNQPREPLESWRALSREAAALLTLKTVLLDRRGPMVSPSDLDRAWIDAGWLCIQQYERAGHLRYRRWPKEKERSRDRSKVSSRISDSANEWLRCGGVLPKLFWRSSRYEFTLELDSTVGPNLFGYLAIQLTFALASMSGFAICPECKSFFSPKDNKVSPKRRNFCPACQLAGKADLYAKRDYRKRQYRAYELSDQGFSVERIAKTIPAKVESVRRWIERRKRT